MRRQNRLYATHSTSRRAKPTTEKKEILIDTRRLGINLSPLATTLAEFLIDTNQAPQMRRWTLGKLSHTFTPQKWEPSVQMGVEMPARRWHGGPT